MTIDKFGSHISHKYSSNNDYYLCYIPLHIYDWEKLAHLQDSTSLLTYKLNELTNTWRFPLPQAKVKICNVFNPTIQFVINFKRKLDTLKGEILTNTDTIIVGRSKDSSQTGNGIIELILEVPIHNAENEQY